LTSSTNSRANRRFFGLALNHISANTAVSQRHENTEPIPRGRRLERQRENEK
jgi:hypothetical protein